MIPSLSEKIQMKELKDKILLRNLCNKLNIDFYNILGFNPEFKFSGSLKDNRFFIHPNKEYDSGSKYNIEFNFYVYYFDKLKVLTREELLSNLTDEILDLIADERRQLVSIFINYVGVRPHGQGIGTLLVNSFIKRFTETNKFEKIFLYPEDTRAKNFWSRLGFRDINIDDLNGKHYPNEFCAEMIYNIR